NTAPAPPYGACCYGRMAPQSPGKDTTSGHWELAGHVLKKPFPVYPRGFPAEITDLFRQAIKRDILGNTVASGTEIIEDLGELHMATGYPIVYTSADSVFQIAAHEKIVPLELLYDWCTEARKILTGEHALGRVIARPFGGVKGSFLRTAGRRDFSLSPPGPTLLDRVREEGYPVAVIGKVSDIFNHRGVTVYQPGGNNEAVAASLSYLIKNISSGLIWATFGDFDTLYGHRNDSSGFAKALEHFDQNLARLKNMLQSGDLLFITADHGCDPTFPTTDHTREYVPVLAWGPALVQNRALGTLPTFADLGASAAQWLNCKPLEHGTSFIW
ncbi:MAG TPA: phosphopentomutase, partial [Candidatus Limnocylindrales bacterium]|nr:phosphopentomutase [Candidatus Limnocylindrales bacterium]